MGNRSVGSFVEETVFFVVANSYVVLASFGGVARVVCASITVITVNSGVGTSSVNANVVGACIEVIAVNIFDCALAIFANLRLAKVGVRASFVTASSVEAQVNCASVSVVTIFVGYVETLWNSSTSITFDSPASIIGLVAVITFDARVRLSVFDARIDNFARRSRSTRLFSVVTVRISGSVQQANNVLTLLRWADRRECTSSSGAVAGSVRASVAGNTFWSEVTASRGRRVGVGGETLVGSLGLALRGGSLVKRDASVDNAFLSNAEVVGTIQGGIDDALVFSSVAVAFHAFIFLTEVSGFALPSLRVALGNLTGDVSYGTVGRSIDTSKSTSNQRSAQVHSSSNRIRVVSVRANILWGLVDASGVWCGVGASYKRVANRISSRWEKWANKFRVATSEPGPVGDDTDTFKFGEVNRSVSRESLVTQTKVVWYSDASNLRVASLVGTVVHRWASTSEVNDTRSERIGNVANLDFTGIDRATNVEFDANGCVVTSR